MCAMSPLSGVLRQAWRLYLNHAPLLVAIACAMLFGPVGIIKAGGYLLARFYPYDPHGWLVPAADILAWSLGGALLVATADSSRNGGGPLVDVRRAVSAALPIVIAFFLARIGVRLGLALFIVPGLILLTFWSLIAPAIVIGRAGPLEAFGHSWRTVRGHGMEVFGTYLLVALTWYGVFVAITFALGGLSAALDGRATAVAAFIGRTATSSTVTEVLMLPFLALVITLIYWRLTAAAQDRAASLAAGGWAGD